ALGRLLGERLLLRGRRAPGRQLREAGAARARPRGRASSGDAVRLTRHQRSEYAGVVPRYDVPKAAPEPLRLVQRFVNTVDHENDREWIGTAGELADFLGSDEAEVDVHRAHELREALRMLLRANNGAPLDASALGVVNRAAAGVRLSLDDRGRVTVGAGDPLARVVAVAFEAMLEGT